MTTELRIKAVELAVGAKHAQQNLSVVSEAQLIYNFLTAANATAEAPAEAPKAAAEKTPRTRKAVTPASGVGSSGEAPAPAASPGITQQVAAGTAQVVEQQKGAVTTPAKKLTIDDIRLALTQLQTRKGSKEVPQKILESFSPTKVTGGVKEEDYARLIAACAAA